MFKSYSPRASQFLDVKKLMLKGRKCSLERSKREGGYIIGKKREREKESEKTRLQKYFVSEKARL